MSLKRKGQHTVFSVIRVYSNEGIQRLRDLEFREVDRFEVSLLNSSRFDLVQVMWKSSVARNEYNTESDWRRLLASWMHGLYFDVLIFEGTWRSR